MKFQWRAPVPSSLRIAAIIALCLVTFLLFLAEVVYAPAMLGQETEGEQGREAVQLLRLISQVADLKDTLDLSIEFGFDPLIVQVTRQLARTTFREHACSCPTWRFIRNDRDLTYLMLSIIAVESRGNFKAFNPGGPAYGLTQMVMSTARHYDKTVTADKLFTIPQHLTIAMDHFVDLLEKYHGNHTLAVLAWNRGGPAVDRSLALGESPHNGYAKMVFTQAVLRNAQ